MMEQTEQPKLSRYLQAGSPIRCFLPSCQNTFRGTCIRGNDGHFYCSHQCAEVAAKTDLTHVEQLRPRRKV